MSSSYEISSDARHLAGELMDMTDQTTGEVNEEAYDAWFKRVEAVCGSIGEKLQRLRAVRIRLLKESLTLNEEAIRLASSSKRRISDAERVRGYMEELLRAHRGLNPGVNRVDTPDGSFVRLSRRTSYEIEADNLSAVAGAFLVPREPRLDRAAIIKVFREDPKSKALAGISVAEVVTEHVREGK